MFGVEAYLYIKSLHIIFVVTWFAGLFYMPRFFIYNTEANTKNEIEKTAIQNQLLKMAKLLLNGITWPSAILTFVFGGWMLLLYYHLNQTIPIWLWLKMAFVVVLFIYHYSLQFIYNQQKNNIYKYTSTQLRIWNEIPTIILISVIFLVVVKTGISLLYGLVGLVCFIIVLMLAIRIYKSIREK